MPPLSLQTAKAKNAEILNKVLSFEGKAQASKKEAWLRQQKLHWIESWRGLKSDSLSYEEEEDVWSQVAGVRNFFHVWQRSPDDSKRNALKEVMDGVNTVQHLTLVGLQHDEEQLEAELLESNQLVEELDAITHETLSDDEEDLIDEMAECSQQYVSDLKDVIEAYVETRTRLMRDYDDAKDKFQKSMQLLPVRDMLSSAEMIVRCLGPMGINALHWVWRDVKKDRLLAGLRNFDRLKFASEALRMHTTAWNQQRFELYELTRNKYRTSLALQELQEEHRLEEEKHLQKDRKTKSRLIELREEKMKKDEKLILEGRKQREEEYDRNFAVGIQRKEHIQQLKDKTAEFQAQKLAVREQLEEEKRVKDEEEENKRRSCCQYHSARVSARHTMAVIKRVEQKKIQYLKEKQEAEAARRLEQALQQLKPKVEADRGRLLQPLQKDLDVLVPPETHLTRGPLAGFTVDQLMKDARYKLGYALYSAGLHETTAANMALAQTKSSVATRRDTFTSHEKPIGVNT